MKKTPNEIYKCVICDEVIETDKPFVYMLQDEALVFCSDHDEPFKIGLQLGSLEINSRAAGYLLDLKDPITKKQIRKALLHVAPNTKFQKPEPKKDIVTSFLNPKGLFDELSKTVIGQDAAKKAISVSVINHLKTIDDEVNFNLGDKHHVLMLGKSGSGKTLIANTIANLFNLPFSSSDATNFSPVGYHGADADSCVHDLLHESEMNFDLAERGIIFLDEIDKICSTIRGKTKVESFMPTSTQSTFLKLIEGKKIKIAPQVLGDPMGPPALMDTDKMLFFFGGAFNGLSDIVSKKLGKTQRSIGFNSTATNKNTELDEAMESYEIFSMASREQIVDSLIEYGMLSEFVGRIPTIVALKPLLKEELVKVLTESYASPLAKQHYLFSKCGYEIEFTDEFIEEVAVLTSKSASGTRGLSSYVKQAIQEASFNLLSLDKTPGGRILITKDCISDPTKYEFTPPKRKKTISAKA